MSKVTLPSAVGRIMSATPESPIAVFRTRQEPGKSSLVKCMFANTVKTQEGLLGLDLDVFRFRQSAIGVSTRKALETASARIVARMIRKGIFEN